FAAKAGNTEIVRLLLTRDDVKTDSTDTYNRTPLSFAARTSKRRFWFRGIYPIPIDTDDDDDDDDNHGLLHQRSRIDYSVVELLLAREVNINRRDEHGRTILFRAAKDGFEHFVKKLLTREDIDVNLPDKNGDSPLHCAVRSGCQNVTSLLL
ncbi:hypothetical protein SERLA73DRAFT_174749, partial [Serpula lacrymans var. lacrymans S7.3]